MALSLNFSSLDFIGTVLIIFWISNFIIIQKYKNRFNEFLKNTKKSDSEGYIQNIQIEEVLEVVA